MTLTRGRPFASSDPYAFPEQELEEITARPAQAGQELRRHRRSEQEMDIEKKLLTPVNYSCHNRPLSEVLNQLAKLVNVNIHIDDEGLREEGLTADMPVTLRNSNSDIMLKSYLNLILENRHFCYIVKDEVLNITSETKKSGTRSTGQVYPVGDLVMPIPNFVASPRMGLAGALHDAMPTPWAAAAAFGTISPPLARGGQPRRPAERAAINPAVMANMAGSRVPARQPAGARRAGRRGAAAPAPISTASST